MDGPMDEGMNIDTSSAEAYVSGMYLSNIIRTSDIFQYQEYQHSCDRECDIAVQ